MMSKMINYKQKMHSKWEAFETNANHQKWVIKAEFLISEVCSNTSLEAKIL